MLAPPGVPSSERIPPSIVGVSSSATQAKVPFAVALAVLASFAFPFRAAGQQKTIGPGKQFYEALESFDLSSSKTLHNVTLRRERAEITFTDGTIYFETPIDGRVYGAVFVGKGHFRADPPSEPFLAEGMHERTGVKSADADFKTAVLRFTDDTFGALGLNSVPAKAVQNMSKLAQKLQPKMLEETGFNIAARLCESVLNGESAGIFLAQFDNGDLPKFTYLIDPQERSVASLAGSRGEKILIFGKSNISSGTEIWLTFRDRGPSATSLASAPEVSDQMRITKHNLNFDLRRPDSEMTYTDEVEMDAAQGGLRVVEFTLNCGLARENSDLYDRAAMHILHAEDTNGRALDTVQEKNDSTLLVFLNETAKLGQQIKVRLQFQRRRNGFSEELIAQPLNWYPIHGFLQRSAFHASFIYPKRYTAVSLGHRVGAELAYDKNFLRSEWEIDVPVPVFGFVLEDTRQPSFSHTVQILPIGARQMPLELYQLGPGQNGFVEAELQNTLQYFAAQFGEYPFESVRGVYGGADRTLATLLFLPHSDISNAPTYLAEGEAAAREWWGNSVVPQSSEDEWLFLGLQSYSAFLYNLHRGGGSWSSDFVKGDREWLTNKPFLRYSGESTKRVGEVAPIILGDALSETFLANLYRTLLSKKSEQVVRMLHFLMDDPDPLVDQPFFDTLQDFANTFRGGSASSRDFVNIANKHFAETAMAKRYGLTDLNWFFNQWVYGAGLPSYRLEYKIDPQPGGSAMLTGTVFQDVEADDKEWTMVLPIKISYPKGRSSLSGDVIVRGKQSPVSIKLPAEPSKVELDPELIVLSLKTSTREIKN